VIFGIDENSLRRSAWPCVQQTKGLLTMRNHTLTLALAFTLSLGSMAVAAPHAAACGGGYGESAAVDPDFLSVRRRAFEFAATRARAAPSELSLSLVRVDIDGDRAIAEVSVVRAPGAVVLRLQLTRTDGGWRVSRWRRVWPSAQTA